MKQMKHNCYKYKLRLMKKLGSLLPSIRGDLMKETVLNDLLQEHEESPFNGSDLTEWLKERERESEIIKTVLRQLKDAQVENNIDVILMDLEVGNLVSYTFTSLNCSDMILPKQKVYLSSSTKEENVEISPDVKQKSWLTAEIQKTMRRNLEIFKNLMNSKDCKPAKFIVSSKEIVNNPGSCILLYESECDEAVCFTPPSKPVCPITEEVKGQSVVLKVVPSSCPATVELRLLYKAKQDTVWTSEPVLKDQDTVTLTDLREETEYEIRCAAAGKLNYTTESNVITVKTGRNMRSSAEKRKGTYQDLKKRFEYAHGQIMSKEKIFKELEKELEVVQDIVTCLTEQSQKSLERLQEIALKPNPLSTPDYIDLMIESETQECKPGFKDRIQSLLDIRKKAVIISKVSTGEVLPEDWKEYKPETRKDDSFIHFLTRTIALKIPREAGVRASCCRFSVRGATRLVPSSSRNSLFLKAFPEFHSGQTSDLRP
ncbi:hypothetical protein G5714_004546 [Onychostoma macrolepis]|uniref:Fibronectin type-III domain-containing protein n=1 Tax=Onychostoma macrolepis TaxID=369639 RepID=A0A7J6D4Z3_9TELE|nr:hypothetical protein G5714_004546 [Onychostoma macrolepis]